MTQDTLKQDIETNEADEKMVFWKAEGNADVMKRVAGFCLLDLNSDNNKDVLRRLYIPFNAKCFCHPDFMFQQFL